MNHLEPTVFWGGFGRGFFPDVYSAQVQFSMIQNRLISAKTGEGVLFLSNAADKMKQCKNKVLIFGYRCHWS